MAPSAVDIDQTYDIAAKGKAISQHPWSDPVPFGGDDQWFYIPETKRFDLSRGSVRKLVVDADDGIRNHRGVMLDPDLTVLVIIDMQNYFIHPTFRHHPGGIAAVEPTLKFIQKCREQGIQVAWLNWGITEHDLKIMPPAVQRGFNRSLVQAKGHGWHVGLGAELPDGQGRCLFKGTWNADIYDPFKEVMTPEDVRFDKARMSGLWSPEEPMHKWLRQSGKKTLLFAGVNTDQCLLGTLTDAYSWGWDCILIGDCAATMTGLEAQAVCD
ncbi:hypothetical protein LTR04_001816, partial [Oleoguttula sp. CCFEE 6159]